MENSGEHHVARIDDTVTSRNLHNRAEAVAVPDFDYLDQAVRGIVEGIRQHHPHLGRHRKHPTPEAGEQQ